MTTIHCEKHIQHYIAEYWQIQKASMLYLIFSVCKPDWYLNSDGGCSQLCPAGAYAVREHNKTDVFCVNCHYSCLSCKGPSDADCITCHEDATLMWSDNAKRCVLNNLSWKMQSTVWYYRMTVVFLINFTVMIVIVVYLVLCWYIRRHRHNHEYSQVSYTGNGEVHADVERLQGDTCVSDSE